MARPVNTLLFLLSGRIARADFSGSATPALLQFWHADRSAGKSIQDSVRAALALGPRCGRNVWVLCEDFWTQVLDFPSTTLAGLEDAQLVRAFAFEAETFSNIPGADAVLGFKQADRGSDLRSYWVTVIEKTTRDAIQDVIRSAGGKLAGMGHPAGVPAPIHAASYAAAPMAEWSRVEVWQRITVCLAGQKTGLGRVEIINAGIAQPRAQTALDAWFSKEKRGSAETLTGGINDVLPPSPHLAADRQLALGSDADFGRWASAWMTCLAHEPKSVPMVAAAPQTTPASVFAFVGVAAAILALGLCYAHWSWSNQSTKQALAAAASHRLKTNAFAELAKKESDAKLAADKLAAENTVQEQAQAGIEREFTAHRGRVALLLKSLAEKRTSDLIVQNIQEDASGALRINGITLDSAYAELFALKLSAELAHSGWEVQPFDKESANLLTNGGPWKFSLTVKEPGAAPVRSTPAASTINERMRR